METGAISESIKQSIYPMIDSFTAVVMTAEAKQRELHLILDRLSAESQVLSSNLEPPCDIQAAVVKCSIIQKRIANLQKKLTLLSAKVEKASSLYV